jgi:cephalosporin hydroxylase
LVWDLNPQKIIEVGVARGGSVILSASILKLLGPSGHVLGVDIDIRKHNRDRIEAHPVADRISLIEGSSVEDSTLVEVKDWLQGSLADIIVLDSNHTHDHVLNELKAYSSLVRVGGYLVLPDTAIEFFPPGYYSDRDWDKGNNPLTALQEFLAEHQNFAIDTARSTKAAITETPSGYVKRIS